MTSDRNVYYYRFRTTRGDVSLLPEGGGKFKILVDHENLGSYGSIEEAFIAAVSGQTEKDWSQGELTDLDIPGDLDKWEKKIFANISRPQPI